MKKNYYLLSIALCLFVGCNKQESSPAYKDATLSIESRVEDLVSRMTLEEKVKQLDMYSVNEIAEHGRLVEAKADTLLNGMSIGSLHDYYPETAEASNGIQRYIIENSRLGIPVLFIEEALHGYQGSKSTAFPIPLGMGGMWDVELMNRIGAAIGSETRSVGVHMVLSPVLGIGREPRWGRVQETYSEDPYLAARSGVEFIKGMQGDDLTKDNAIISEPKHFGIHSIPEGGKNAAPVFIGEREARSNFLYVFEKAYKEGGALGAMAAYHEWDGVPAAGDHWLLTELLRDEWGFKGMVLSDLGAIAKQMNSHHTAKTPKEAITSSISAGLDMQFYDYSHDVFESAIIDAVADKSLSMESVDRAVSSVLYVKFKLGLFENPYIDNGLKAKRYHSQENQDIALEAAHKSIALLQNRNNILPFSNRVKNVAVIGDMASKVSLGGYSPKNVEGVSISEAFESRDYNVNIVNVGVPSDGMEQINANYLLTESGERGLTAEYFNNSEMRGEPALTQVETKLSQYWHNLSPAAGVASDNFSIRWTGYIVPELTGEYEFTLKTDDVGRLSIDNKVLIDNWDPKTKNIWSEHKSVRLEAGERYPIKVEYAEYDQLAGIELHMKISPEEKRKENLFDRAVKAAERADVVVLVLGENDDECGEGKDKLSLELNRYSKKLLDEVSKAGTPIVLVLQNGRPLILTEECEKVDAILETWYAGELGGVATVDILSGKVNPSGKLPITFPRSNGQIPIYYNQKKSSTGSYVDGSNQPLFAFGHGLSYSEFAYSDIAVGKANISTDEEQIVTVKVKNSSDVDGEEVVQLYIVDSYSSVVTQKMQLRGFQRVALKAGEEREVEFTLLPDDLALWNRAMERVVEPGEFLVKVGSASDDIRLESKFEVK